MAITGPSPACLQVAPCHGCWLRASGTPPHGQRPGRPVPQSSALVLAVLAVCLEELSVRVTLTQHNTTNGATGQTQSAGRRSPPPPGQPEHLLRRMPPLARVGRGRLGVRARSGAARARGVSPSSWCRAGAALAANQPQVPAHAVRDQCPGLVDFTYTHSRTGGRGISTPDRAFGRCPIPNRRPIPVKAATYRRQAFSGSGSASSSHGSARQGGAPPARAALGRGPLQPGSARHEKAGSGTAAGRHLQGPGGRHEQLRGALRGG